MDVLGLVEVPKPPVLAARGGCWFELGPTRCTSAWRTTSARPARPIRRCSSTGSPRSWTAAGLAFTWADDVAGTVHGYVDDPFGNRIELVDATGGT